MTLEQLEQYRDQKKELGQLKRRIDEVAARSVHFVSDTVQASLEEFPYVKHTVTVRGIDENAENRHRRLLATYERRRARLEREQLEVEQWIDALKDSKLRQIVTMRYVQGSSWRRVGSEVCGSPSYEDAVRMRIKRLFEKNS